MMNNNGLYPDTPVSGKTIQSDFSLVFGVLLALASTGAMVYTLQSLVTGVIPKALACVAGLALQGCLYLFSNSANHRVRGFSVVLLVLSVMMSTWFMEAAWSKQQAQQNSALQVQVNNRYDIEQVRVEVDLLNSQIHTLQLSSDDDIKNGYRARGLATQNDINDLKAKRQILLDKFDTLKDQQPTAPVPVFEAIIWVRLSLFFLIAMVIDIAAIIALQPADTPKARQTKPGNDGTRQTNDAKHKNDRPKYSSQPALVAVNNDAYLSVVKAIRSGQVPPSKNQVRKQLNIGAEKVADYFRLMVSEGILYQDDRGWYQLALAA